MIACNFQKELSTLIKARFPVIYIITWEEKRLAEAIKAMVKNDQLFSKERDVWEWTILDGFKCNEQIKKGDIKTSLQALNFIDSYEGDGIFILKDLYADLARPVHTIDQPLIRKLKDLVWSIKEGKWLKTLIITAYEKFIPDDLQKEILIKSFDLPTKEELREMLLNLVEQNKHNPKLKFDLSNNTLSKLCDAACGLTLHEAENAFALSIVKDGELNEKDVSTIAEEKKQIIQRNGLLEFSMPKLKMEDVGGLQNLKNWLVKRSDSWSEKANKYNLPSPRGVLITGLPGCGKSLTAKTISSLWNIPLLRLDMGALYSGLVGSSERNMRNVIQTAEAMAPCVLWVDEIEKAFSGIGSSGDSGVATRMFGTFLTWMQEKEKFVFVAATANQIHSLPPELMRKGRFDEIFFVDLPTQIERQIILDIHIKKRFVNPKVIGSLVIDKAFVDRLTTRTEGFTGAEIEQVVVSALFEAFAENRSVTEDDFVFAIESTVPLVVTQAEQIASIRQWANLRAVSATSGEHKSSEEIEKPSMQRSVSKPELSPRGGRSIEF
ncbi:MAG: AAA family ATPase [Candidatus Azobacteroides sp.]|nr:AAA family ATPase [Candidatus Azobacteroides sp.]